MLIKAWHIVVVALWVLSFNPPERLAWEEGRLLKWSDFKGAPDNLSGFVATTNSGISHSFAIGGNGVLDKSTSKILAHFYPTFSWVKPARATKAILKHEQNHFDISEIYARKLRKRVQEFQFTTNSEEEIKNIYESTEEERRNTQQLFDKESDHSKRKNQELLWTIRIKDSLKKYEAYAL